MEHAPSKYTATLTLTIQQMIEVHKAISARLVFLSIETTDEKHPDRWQDVEDLLKVAEMLDAHEERARDEWEEKVARAEAVQLDDFDALRRFFEQ